MSRRFILAAMGLCAALMVSVIGTGCGPTTKVSELEQLAPPRRLLAIEAAGPETEGFPAALAALLRDRSPVIRAQAAQTLVTWAATGEAALAIPALNHRDPLVRGIAQAAYIEHSAYGLAPLATGRNTIIEVPPAVLDALAEMDDRHGRVDLKAVLQGHTSALRNAMETEPETSVLAADLLARVGDAGARRHLIRLVETAEGPVRYKAIRACVRGDMSLGPTLLPLAFKGDVESRRAAMRAMVVSPDPRLRTLPIKALRDPDAAVRRNAIRALGNLGGAAPIDALAAKLKGPDAEKADALRALGAIGKPAADVLRHYLQTSKDPDAFQVTGLLALAPNANRDDIAWVAPRLKSKSKYVRAAAAAVLGRIGHPSAQAALVTALKDRDPLARAAVAKALGQIGTIYAAKQLVPLLKDPSPLVASMAAWGLGASRYADAVDALKEVAMARVSHKAAPSRVGDMYGQPELAATEALGRIGGTKAVAALRGSLKSRSWLTRATAAEALGRAGDKSPEVMADLDELLKDRTNLVRAQALLSLKTLGRTFGPGAFQTK